LLLVGWKSWMMTYDSQVSYAEVESSISEQFMLLFRFIQIIDHNVGLNNIIYIYIYT
jgi:hypothetical protein